MTSVPRPPKYSTPTPASRCAVPAFLARGYHVSTDIPAHVGASDHPAVTVTPALGPDPALVRVVVDRLVESGWRTDDSVILAAAGTSDPAALRDLHTTAAWVSATIGTRVELAFAATGEPRVADAVTALRQPAVALSSRRICCPKGCSRIDCATAAPMS